MVRLKSGWHLLRAQTAVDLEEGTHWIDLSFYGLMFHDRKVSGRLRLGTVALTTVGQKPNALGDPLENAHVTRPVRPQQMRTLPFGRPDLLACERRLEPAASWRLKSHHP